MKELRAGTIPKREQDPYDIDPEDEKYLLETGDFWDKNSMSAIVDEYRPSTKRKALSETPSTSTTSTALSTLSAKVLSTGPRDMPVSVSVLPL